MKKVIVVAMLVAFCTAAVGPRKAAANDDDRRIGQAAAYGAAIGVFIGLLWWTLSPKHGPERTDVRPGAGHAETDHGIVAEKFAANTVRDPENSTVWKYAVHFKF
ncbi:hypothetical protein FO488_04445 [Geobacter sp. FeAm09]|uniref:hypothetical protein n=1 Tax=Geobacter sp. FeAm09 TaxID=2597769 RepID=UPI0011EC71EA|nr:hypothetical protein [Geobacter sp. FeAm09]QEM67466.1 hypothetical protein FO488_04445 [Geobacter sp. FeAm09]